MVAVDFNPRSRSELGERRGATHEGWKGQIRCGKTIQTSLRDAWLFGA